MKTTTRLVLTAHTIVFVTLCGADASLRAEEKPLAAGATSTPIVVQNRFSIRLLPNQIIVPAVFRMEEGETAGFTVQAPFDGSLAIHGYAKDMPLQENVVMTFSLTATRTGRFPLHVHTKDGRHVEVGFLEVMPH